MSNDAAVRPTETTATHGAWWYRSHGCRCASCREGQRLYVQRWRAAMRARLAEDPNCAPHGRYSTYVNYGCRCEDCSAVHNAACRKAWAHRASLGYRPPRGGLKRKDSKGSE